MALDTICVALASASAALSRASACKIAACFLWLGISAILIGIIFVILPISWQLQWVCFASFSLVTTWGWWRFQYKEDRQSEEKQSLNQKEKQLIGKT